MASFFTYLKLCAVLIPVASQLQKISPNDNTADHDNFGWSVSINGQYFAAGAHASQNAAAYGSVRIFTSDSENNWVQSATLLAMDGTIGDLFGYSVSLYDPYIIIGAHKDDDNGADSGSAYIFARAGDDTWTLMQKVTASDGAMSDYFGRAVSLYGTYAAIGAAQHDANGPNSGAVYIFEGVATIWSQSAKLLPSDGMSADNFGYSVSIYDTFVAVGAYSDDEAGTDSGSAYVFERVNGNWVQHTKLVPDDAAAGDWFGISVSIYGNFMVVGACYNDNGGSNAGSAYIFAFDEALDTWTQSATLVPNDTMANQQFGRAVSIHGTYAVIGTYENPNGSAYVFELDEVNNVWREAIKLVPSDGANYDQFGHAVANYYNEIVVGAPYVDDNGVNSGSVYVTAMIEPITETPSRSPSDVPTQSPTNVPSNTPSNKPSNAPSNDPSNAPSNDPSNAPSNDPSNAPSNNPSNAPSNNPSNAPSNNPSLVPSDSPSDAPTNPPEETTTDSAEETTEESAGLDPKSDATTHNNTLFVALIYCILFVFCV